MKKSKLNKEIINNIEYVEPVYWKPKQNEALFPREILQPLYEKWRNEEATSMHAEDFYYFLLKQTK